jgi:aryl-alcohol dehydrogenase-like predicted oxidoreductase
MPPQAIIFAATRNVTPLAAVPDRRNTVLGRPVAVRNFLAYSLRRLGTDYIDVHRLGRVDPRVPIEDTVGAIAEMIGAGYVRHVGLSGAGAETVRRAHAIHTVADLQIEYSLLSRGIEAEILPTCRQLGVGLTAYGVLSRGLLGGTWSSKQSAAPSDMRAHMPRFRRENLERNLALVDALRAIADAKGVTAAQIAIAWVLARGQDIVPLVGTTRRDRLAEAVGALELELSEDDLAAIERAVPPDAVAGDRYDERQMAMLDSEAGARPKV